MFVQSTFWMWTTGSFTTTTTVSLDRNRRYLVTGGLVGKEGGDYGQALITSVCTISGDHVLCGIRDDANSTPDSNIKNRGLTEFLPPNAIRVTLKLRSSGGRHRAEGVVYDIT